MKRVRVKFAPVRGIAIVFFLMPHAVRSQTFAGTSKTVKDSPVKFISEAKASSKDVDTGHSPELSTIAAGAYMQSTHISEMYTVAAPAQGSKSQISNLKLVAAEEKRSGVVLGAESQQQATPPSKLPPAPQPNPQTPPAGNPNAPSLQDLGFGASQTQGSAKEQALLNKRTHMLKVHQTLGLITAIPMVATLITGPQAKAKGKNGQPITEPTDANLDFHMALGGLTTGLYFTTAYYAIFAPKIPGVKPKGAIRLHRDLEWVHGPGMIITPILGIMAYKQENAGEKVHGIASAHGTAAYITAAAYGASIVAVSWPIQWKFWER